ncbi:MAG: hypothetical protein NZ922_01315 [Candidatus Methanomethyliaceae archaeon]|nr:hypothetical protein [Candidatus Methanomethyliaceae archaeon]MDW7970388.1 hypothetical protein [Nitrososphaerota archaeon]
MCNKDLITVILDTNIIMYSTEKPFDITNQLIELGFFRIIIIESVKKELEKLAIMGGVKERRNAKLALKICENFEFEPDPPISGGVDEKLLFLAKTKGYIIATCDSDIRKKLRENGLPVIYLKDERLIAEVDLVTKINSKINSK